MPDDIVREHVGRLIRPGLFSFPVGFSQGIPAGAGQSRSGRGIMGGSVGV